MFHKEGFCVRNSVLLQLDNVVRTVVCRTDLQVVTAHLRLHLGPEMIEENVTAEVGLKLSLRVGLWRRELLTTLGTQVNLHCCRRGASDS